MKNGKFGYSLLLIGAAVLFLVFFSSINYVQADSKCTSDQIEICRFGYGSCCNTNCCATKNGGTYCNTDANSCPSTEEEACNNGCVAQGCDRGIIILGTVKCECRNTDGTVCNGNNQDNSCPPALPTNLETCQNYCACRQAGEAVWEPTTRTCTCKDETTNPTDPSSGGTVTIGPPYGGSGPQSIGELIGNITSWVLGIAGAITVLFIILAGLRYITSHGDTKQAEAAKTTLRNAIVGLVIVVISFFLVRLVVSILTGQA